MRNILFDTRYVYVVICKPLKALQSGVKEKIEKLLQEGRRAMIGEDFQGSLQPLSECCHLITTNFGEMDPQLAGANRNLFLNI